MNYDGTDTPLTRFVFTVEIHAETAENAEQVMAERLGYDEDYGFTYEFGARSEAEVAYRAGDPDPTPDAPDSAQCLARGPMDTRCTWAKGHEGSHVAGNSDEIVAVFA